MTTVSVIPTGKALGADIRGVNLAYDIDAASFHAILYSCSQPLLLRLRGPKLSHPEPGPCPPPPSFHADAQHLAQCGQGYLLAQARAHAFRHGFFDQTAQLWNEAGTLLATSTQMVHYKE